MDCAILFLLELRLMAFFASSWGYRSVSMCHSESCTCTLLPKCPSSVCSVLKCINVYLCDSINIIMTLLYPDATRKKDNSWGLIKIYSGEILLSIIWIQVFHDKFFSLIPWAPLACLQVKHRYQTFLNHGFLELFSFRRYEVTLNSFFVIALSFVI